MLKTIALTILVLTVCRAEAKYTIACRTNANLNGVCVPLHSCTNLLTALDRIQDSGAAVTADDPDVLLLRQSSCGQTNGVNHVCCDENQIQLNRVGVQILRKFTCGIFTLPKISNGKEADLFTFPWMALLKYKNNQFRCGGSLISDRYVLTAAHCVDKKDDPVLEVRLGEFKISTEPDCRPAGQDVLCAPPVEDYGIEKIMVPNERDQQHWLHNDIALLRLNQTVEFNSAKKHIKPICLPITPDLLFKSQDNYIISGWGRTQNASSSDVLMWTYVPHRKLEDCERQLGVKDLSELEICAGGEGLKDSCVGDSGGPLAQADRFDKQTRLIQFGIVSTGIEGCGQVSVPAIYTSISHHLQWITDNLEL